MIVQPKVLVSRSAATSREKDSKTKSKLPVITATKAKKKIQTIRPVVKKNDVMPVVVLPRSIAELARELLGQEPKDDGSCGSITLKFNHYNKVFPIHNGVLKWTAVDDEYAFSFVYRGNYIREISPCEVSITGAVSNIRGSQRRDDKGDYFLDLQNGRQYIVKVEEDPEAGIGAEGLRTNFAPLLASAKAPSTSISGTSCAGVISGNNATRLLTEDLIKIVPSQLSSQEAKDLIERRDIEDILFS